MRTRTHARTHTHTHARTRARAHTRTHTHTHARARTNTNAPKVHGKKNISGLVLVDFRGGLNVCEQQHTVLVHWCRHSCRRWWKSNVTWLVRKQKLTLNEFLSLFCTQRQDTHGPPRHQLFPADWLDPPSVQSAGTPSRCEVKALEIFAAYP